jgi:hypothetical protein
MLYHNVMTSSNFCLNDRSFHHDEIIGNLAVVSFHENTDIRTIRLNVLAPPKGRRSDPNYTQLAGLIPKRLAEEVRVYCAKRDLTISELMEAALQDYIDNQEVEEYKQRKNQAENQPIRVEQEPPTIAQLVAGWDLRALADSSRLSIERLQSIAHGAYPTDRDLILLGRWLRKSDGELYQTVQLMEIRDRDFPNQIHENDKPITNGT